MLDAGEPIERVYLCIKCGDLFDSEDEMQTHELFCLPNRRKRPWKIKPEISRRALACLSCDVYDSDDDDSDQSDGGAE
ncbi:unnamed protein product [Sphagnum balticum]